jgi:hypothetical protein
VSTRDLIEAALAARAAYDQAVAATGQTSQSTQDAFTALKAASQAVHDDLAATGPCCIIDDESDPPMVTMYNALKPDSFLVTPIRVAV